MANSTPPPPPPPPLISSPPDDLVWDSSQIPEKKKLNVVVGGAGGGGGGVGTAVRAWRGPRTVSLQRCDHGFGFTLRHFIVYPPDITSAQADGDPGSVGVGETCHATELEPMDTIFVKHVKDGSPAQRAGLTTGDRVVSVNGETVAGKSYSQVVQLIQRSGSTLQLLVVPKEDDILQLYFPSTAYRSSPDDHRQQRRPCPAPPPTSGPHCPMSGVATCRPDLGRSHLQDAKDPRTSGAPQNGDLGRRRFSDLPSLFRSTDVAAPIMPGGRGVPFPASAGPGGQFRTAGGGSTWSVATVGLGLGLGIGLNMGSNGVPPPLPQESIGSADRTRSALDLMSAVAAPGTCKMTVAGSTSTVTVYSVGGGPRFSTVPSGSCVPSLSGPGGVDLPGARGTMALSGTSLDLSFGGSLDQSGGSQGHHGSHGLGSPMDRQPSCGERSAFAPLVACPPAPEYVATVRSGSALPGGSDPSNTSGSPEASEHADPSTATDSIINRLKASFEKKEEFLLRSTPPSGTSADVHYASSLNGGTTVREYYPHPQRFVSTPLWPPPTFGGSADSIGAPPGGREALQPNVNNGDSFDDDGVFGSGSKMAAGKTFTSNLGRIQETCPGTDLGPGDSLPKRNVRHGLHGPFDRHDGGTAAAPLPPIDFVPNLGRIQENIPTADPPPRDGATVVTDQCPSLIRPLVGGGGGASVNGHGGHGSSSSSGESPPPTTALLSKASLFGGRPLRYPSLRKACSLDSDLVPGARAATAASFSSGGAPTAIGSGVSSSSGGSTVSVDGGGATVADAGRMSALHLVSQRARQFEQGALQQEANNRMNLYRNELARLTTRGQTPSVSDRAAQFESLSTSQETLGSESDYSSQSPRTKPTAAAAVDSWKEGGLSRMLMQRSLDGQLRSNGPCAACSAPGSRVETPQSSSGALEDDLQRRRAVRQNSYLAAVKAPYLGSSPLEGGNGGTSGSSPSPVGPAALPGGVVLRRKTLYEDGVVHGHHHHGADDDPDDGDVRLMRRVSYLKATSGGEEVERREAGTAVTRWALTEGEEDDAEEEEQEQVDGGGGRTQHTRGRLPHRVPHHQVAPTRGGGASQHQRPPPPPAANHYSGFQNHRQVAPRDLGKPNGGGGAHQGLLPRNQSTQKLKAFFGERTPLIMETYEKCSVTPLETTPPLPSEVLREAWLQCKVAACDGKRTTDRSWKQTWAVLRGSCLALYRDKKDAAHQILATMDDQPIDLRSCQVDVASDYSKKKKHVFRVVTASGTEYLLQAPSDGDMQHWIRAIQDGLDVNGKRVISQGIVSRKSALFESGSVAGGGGGGGHLSPVTGPKGIRKLTTFRNRSPTGHSPTSKARKSSQGDDTSPKSKTWRGKMVKTIRKIHGPSPASILQPEGVTVGVPLEECPPSSVSEFVPLLVELCTSIVEARGLEVIGIYRVPGNTAAVSFLLEAVNHGFESLNLQDPRWNDVNVISSLLKAFFRKLPDPLVTSELYPLFIEASKNDDPVQRMYDLKKMLHELPDHNYETLRYLIRHLQKVVAHSTVNKMEARNLAIVFGPTLVRAADDNMVSMVTDMSFQCRIVEMFISHANWFFSTDENEDLTNQNFPPSGRESDAAGGVSKAIQSQLLLNNLQKMEHGVVGGGAGIHHHQAGEMRLLKDVTAKDLVSSIIGAANRKVRQKMKKHQHHHHHGGHHQAAQQQPESRQQQRHAAPEERDIDREIELRLRRLEPSAEHRLGADDRKGDATATAAGGGGGLKVERRHSEDSSTSSLSTSRTTSEDCTSPRKMSMDSLDGFQQGAGIPTRIPIGAGDRERAFCVVRQASINNRILQQARAAVAAASGGGTASVDQRVGPGGAPPVESPSATVSQKEGFGGDHQGLGPANGGASGSAAAGSEGVLKTYAGLSASMQERIRQFELETRALLKRDAQNRQKSGSGGSAIVERRELDRQRIEMEWQRAKRDMEQDDFLDRLADDPSVAKKISDITQKIQSLHRSHLEVAGGQWSPASSSSSTASKGGSASSFEHDLDSLPFIDSVVPPPLASSSSQSSPDSGPPSQDAHDNKERSDRQQRRPLATRGLQATSRGPEATSRGPQTSSRGLQASPGGPQAAMKRVSSADSFVSSDMDPEVGYHGMDSKSRARHGGRLGPSSTSRSTALVEMSQQQRRQPSSGVAPVAADRRSRSSSDLERMGKWCGSLDSLREFYETTIQEERPASGKASVVAHSKQQSQQQQQLLPKQQTDIGASKNSDWVSRHPRVPPYQPPPAPPSSAQKSVSQQKQQRASAEPQSSKGHRHQHHHQGSVGSEESSGATDLWSASISQRTGGAARRPVSMEDVRFHRNESTLIKATMFTSSHTISSTSTTAVMTATITSKSSRPTYQASSSSSRCPPLVATAQGAPPALVVQGFPPPLTAQGFPPPGSVQDVADVARTTSGHCQTTAQVSGPAADRKVEGQKRVLSNEVCENGVKKGRSSPCPASSTLHQSPVKGLRHQSPVSRLPQQSQEGPPAPSQHLRKSSHLRNLKRRHTVGGTKDFEKFRVLAGDCLVDGTVVHHQDSRTTEEEDEELHRRSVADSRASVAKSKLRRGGRMQTSSPDLHVATEGPPLGGACNPVRPDRRHNAATSGLSEDKARNTSSCKTPAGTLESQV